MTNLTRTTYNYREGISSSGSFFVGGNINRVYTFPDTINDVVSIDFIGMKTEGGSWVSIRNTTQRQNGGFGINAYDSDNNIIGQSYLQVKKNETKLFNDMPKITLPAGSNVKKIAFYSQRKTAHMTVNHDTTSEFSIMVNRDSLFQPIVEEKTPTTAKLSWDANLTGNKYRIVHRVKNAYRNIADESDIVLLENVTGSSATLSELSLNSDYIISLQKLGNEWYDVGQVTFKTGMIDIDLQIEEVGSTYIKLAWNNESGYSLKVTAISPSDTKSIVTSEKNSVIIRDLLPDVNYEVQVILV